MTNLILFKGVFWYNVYAIIMVGAQYEETNILLVLKILETESDESHPITQLKIADIISAVYPCDRKTVGRNIAYLIKLGYPIVKTLKGFYMGNKQFTLDECKLIVSAVRESPNIPESQRSDIANKLTNALSKIYK